MPLQVAIHLAILAVQRRLHLLGVRGQLVAAAQTLELFQPGQPTANGAEVGQRAAQPAVADVGHAAARGLALDRLARLPLGAHEQHQAAAGGDLLQILLGPQQPANRFADVDDVDQILAGVDVRPHLGVPAARPMAEMNPGFDQLLDQHWHETLLALAHRQLVATRKVGRTSGVKK